MSVDHSAQLAEASRTCPLCHQTDTNLYFEDKRRPYLQCSQCDLVFVPDVFRLEPDEEKAVYDLHENDFDDPGYRRFLSRCLDPVVERINKGDIGLDFGCGPGPVLASMFEEKGWSMAIYDPIYHSDDAVFSRQYNFITSTEVIEHVYEPDIVLKKLIDLLAPQGLLALMTKRVRSKEAFAGWHYKNDVTHVGFYSDATFQWIADQYRLELTFVGADLALLKK